MRLTRQFWTAYAVVSLAVLLTASVSWSLAHPFGISWDESEYLNLASTDTTALRVDGLPGLKREIFYADHIRPPAFRLLAAPVFFLLGFSVATSRLVAVGFSIASILLLYLTARRLVDTQTAAFTVLLLALSPEILFAMSFFSTEYPLYLATSTMLYLLVRIWTGGGSSSITSIVMGLALGVGLLAKASFVLIAGPLLIFALVAGRLFAVPGPNWAWLVKATALGIGVAAPWWWKNASFAFDYARYARNFVRHSFGPPSATTWLLWLNAWLQCVLGFGLSVLAVLVVVAFVREARRRRQIPLSPTQRAVLVAAACASVPLVIVQLSGTNHLMRYLSPTMFPVAIALGILADRTGWAVSRATLLTSSVLLTLQLVAIAGPVVYPNLLLVEQSPMGGRPPWRVFVRFDQWDWRPLRDVSRNHGLQHPAISYLGSAEALNPSQIAYPWKVQGESTGGVTWLWRYEEGPIDWRRVIDQAGQSDLVLTAPRYVGQHSDKQDLDNQHNAELVERLSRDGRFTGPTRLVVGRFEPVEILIFARKPHSDG